MRLPGEPTIFAQDLPPMPEVAESDRARAAEGIRLYLEDLNRFRDEYLQAVREQRMTAARTALAQVKETQQAFMIAGPLGYRPKGVPIKGSAEAFETGPRGGRYYVSATGAKVYVTSNPGARVVGHMRDQRFHQGLPMSVHLAEPCKTK